MGKLIDLTGNVFGKLTVLSFNGVNSDHKSLWTCQCECGELVVKRGKILRKGKELYCGSQHPTKICTECKKDKLKSEYHKCSNSKIGIGSKCKECIAKWYEDNKDAVRNLYLESMKNNDKKKRKYEINKKSRVKNREQQRKQKIEYSSREYVKTRKKETHKLRKQTDINYNIKRRLRWRIRDTVKKIIGNSYKYKSSLVLLGCDMDFFKTYMEEKFTDGMNWNNISEWHIDHIKPCSKFDLTKLLEQKECFHYSNLQPLWWKDNLVKGTTFGSINLIRIP